MQDKFLFVANANAKWYNYFGRVCQFYIKLSIVLCTPKNPAPRNLPNGFENMPTQKPVLTCS